MENSGGRFKVESTEPAYLIVNADDYAYFDCVSRGILECAKQGAVTATGVFANSPFLEEHAAWLMSLPQLDVGVHLNLTDRAPLTSRLTRRWASRSGDFPGKFVMAQAIVGGSIGVDLIKEEWRAQIERCLAAGLGPRFLNSHEHLHMLPQLYPVAAELAREYGIDHLRIATPEWPRPGSGGALLRDAIMAVLTLSIRMSSHRPAPHFLGMGSSGRLSQAYLRERLAGLGSGEVYELMCHPGFLDPQEIGNSSLLGYHDWDQERMALSGPGFASLLQQHNIRLIGYRHLRVEGSGLRVIPEGVVR